MSIPTLTGDEVVLRPLTIADAPALFPAHSDPEVQKFRRGGLHKNVEETKAYIDSTLKRAQGNAWAITESGGDALGRIALRTLHEGVGEIGIVMRREAQRRGLASKAILLVEKYAFETVGLHRLLVDIDPDNSASLSLFIRAGFEREGLLRQHWITDSGYRDAVIMAKLREAGPSVNPD